MRRLASRVHLTGLGSAKIDDSSATIAKKPKVSHPGTTSKYFPPLETQTSTTRGSALDREVLSRGLLRGEDSFTQGLVRSPNLGDSLAADLKVKVPGDQTRRRGLIQPTLTRSSSSDKAEFALTVGRIDGVRHNGLKVSVEDAGIKFKDNAGNFVASILSSEVTVIQVLQWLPLIDLVRKFGTILVHENPEW